MASEKASFPFQSSQAADIHAHMSVDEKTRLRRISSGTAAIMGLAIGICTPLVRRWLGRGHDGGLGAEMLSSALIAFGLGLLLLPWSIRSVKTQFASTEYAKSRGITAKGLRLYSFTGKRG